MTRTTAASTSAYADTITTGWPTSAERVDAPAAGPAEVPEQLGRYHVLGLAGRGNMAVVYTGYDPYEDRDVAIKVCTAVADADGRSEALARKLFYNEAHTAGLLDHPNIVRVFDAGEHDGQLYIVMEYVDGGETLDKFCGATSLLPVRQVAEIAYACAGALDYAHRQGIVHRDIKPTNVLLTADGELKLGDFGIAERRIAPTTEVLGLVGTPHFMSPEQVEQRKLTGQSDLYSLGVVLFRLLTGRFPFEGSSLESLLYNICHHEPLSLRSVRPDVPDGLCQVVEFAMARDLAKRYSTGREIAADLAAIFADLEASAPTVDEDERFELARGLRFFSDFDAPQLRELLRASQWENREAGDTIVTADTLDMSFFVIVSGEISVVEGGRAISTLEKGDCFGELGYVSRGGRSTTILASGDASLVKLDAAAMNLTSTDCQLQFHKAFVRHLIERLSRTRGAAPRTDAFDSTTDPIGELP